MNKIVQKIIYRSNHQNRILFKLKRSSFFRNSHFENDFLDKNSKKVEEFYETEEKLSFEDGKFLIWKSQCDDVKYFKNFQLMLVLPFNIYFGYKTIHNLIMIGTFKSVIIWGGLFMLSLKIYLGLRVNLNQFINNIFLLEDGFRTEFSFYSSMKNIVTDNINIRKPSAREVMLIVANVSHILEKFVPLIINQKMYFLAKTNETYNKPIFLAIMNGNYIKFKRSDEKIIDIK